MPKTTDDNARELDLHRRAAAGDAKAKAELAAKEARIDLDNRCHALFEKARGGDAGALAEMRAIASGGGGKAGSPPATATQSFTSLDVARADTKATERERKRVADVFASEHSKGRERGCATLLTAKQGWSAAKIIAELPHLPTDAELARGKRNADADATWDKARRILDAQQGRSVNAMPLEAGKQRGRYMAKPTDPWERAYAQAAEGR